MTAVAAAERLDVSLPALRALAQFHMGDLRACLFTLQVTVPLLLTVPLLTGPWLTGPVMLIEMVGGGGGGRSFSSPPQTKNIQRLDSNAWPGPLLSVFGSCMCP